MAINNDLKVISKKLGWDYNVVEHSINKLIRDEVVSSDVFSKKEIIEYLKICSESKDLRDRKNQIIKFLTSRQYKDIVKTIIYFLQYDYVFTVLWHFFDYLDDNRIKGKYYKPSGKIISENAEAFYGLAFYCNFLQDEIEHKKQIILDYLIHESNWQSRDIPNIDKLILQLVSEIGFNVIRIESLKDYFLEGMVSNRDDFEHKVIKYLLFYKKKKTNKQRWRNYFLVNELKKRKYGTRESFRLVGRLYDKPDTSISRRYYEISKKIKDKELDVKESIQKLNLKNELIRECKNIDFFGKDYFDKIEAMRKRLE